jgi:hypothetical protein
LLLSCSLFFCTSKLKTAATGQPLKQPGFTERKMLFTDDDHLAKIIWQTINSLPIGSTEPDSGLSVCVALSISIS